MKRDIFTFSDHFEYLISEEVFYSEKYDANYIISDCGYYAMLNTNKDCLYNACTGSRMFKPNGFEHREIAKNVTVIKGSFKEHGTMAKYRNNIYAIMKENGICENNNKFSYTPFLDEDIHIEVNHDFYCRENGDIMPFKFNDTLTHKQKIALIVKLALNVENIQIEPLKGYSYVKLIVPFDCRPIYFHGKYGDGSITYLKALIKKYTETEL